MARQPGTDFEDWRWLWLFPLSIHRIIVAKKFLDAPGLKAFVCFMRILHVEEHY